MSNNQNLQALLNAVNQATRPFNAVRTAASNLSADINQTQQSLNVMQAQLAQVESFRQSRTQLNTMQQALKAAKAEAAALAVSMRNTASPTAEQASALESARQAARRLQSDTASLRQSVQQQRAALNTAGIATRSLSSEQLRLRRAAGEASATLGRQREALQRLHQQQERLNQTAERYRKGQALAGKVRSVGAAGMQMASAGAGAGMALLKPGYDFARTREQLRARLGLAKDAPALTALNDQARQPDISSSVPANEVARTQLAIAQAGGDADTIQAATPVSLNLAQASGQSAQESASLLMQAKAAFGLTNQEIAHTGDVLAVTLHSGVDFASLTRAISAVGAEGQKAGVTLEQTAARLSLQADGNASGDSLQQRTQQLQQSDGAAQAGALAQQDNLGGDIERLRSASEAIDITLYQQMEGTLRQLTQTASGFLLRINQWIQANPELVTGIAKVATAGLTIAGAIGAIGMIAGPVISGVSAIIAGAGLLGTAFTLVGGAITAATWPVVALGAALVAGALLIRKYWEPISAFISGAAEGFTAAMGPISAAFDPLRPVFNWFMSKVKSLGEWFGALLEPIHATQQQLQSAGDLGRKFGGMLAEGLKLAAAPLAKLSGGIVWILEKLGIIDKPSDGQDKKAPPPDARDEDSLYRSIGRSGSYNPLKPAVGNSLNDQSTRNYQYDIHMPEGITQSLVVETIRQMQESDERRRRSEQLSSMGWAPL